MSEYKIKIEITHKREVFARVLKFLEKKRYEYKGFIITSINYEDAIENPSEDITIIFGALKSRKNLPGLETTKERLEDLAEWYISPFDFFYAKNEDLGIKFAKAAFEGCYTMESENYTLCKVLNMIAKGFKENENAFIDQCICVSDLIAGTLKRVLPCTLE